MTAGSGRNTLTELTGTIVAGAPSSRWGSAARVVRTAARKLMVSAQSQSSSVSARNPLSRGRSAVRELLDVGDRVGVTVLLQRGSGDGLETAELSGWWMRRWAAMLLVDERLLMKGAGMSFVSRGFARRRRDAPPGRLPPGQYDVGDGFPVLSAGPTPHTSLTSWDFRVQGQVDEVRRWSWTQFQALPRESVSVDVHCVTSWSKFDSRWEGVSVDTLLADVVTAAEFMVAFCDGGYTTNLPLADLTGGQAWVVDIYDGQPLAPEHGGPARLLVPHLYFWKSAKWVRGLELTLDDEPGFWETFGYHNYGDPWREQRYAGD
jgi:DMSO/TMAO reductase YedYZ molybdopterin-dependent catalytic subunit